MMGYYRDDVLIVTEAASRHGSLSSIILYPSPIVVSKAFLLMVTTRTPSESLNPD
jgi:hypothetical protein